MADLSDRVHGLATHLQSPEQILQQAKGSPQPRPEQAAAPVAAGTETERAVAAIWGDVLGISDVGIDDDFFALGGHSLMVMQVLTGIREIFGVELPLSAAFTETLTVRELARKVELAQIGTASAATAAS